MGIYFTFKTKCVTVNIVSVIPALVYEVSLIISYILTLSGLLNQVLVPGPPGTSNTTYSMPKFVGSM